MKHSTFNIQHSTLILISAFQLFSFSAFAADISPGYVFSDVETDANSLVTSNALSLLGSGTLRTNAIRDRTEAPLNATNNFLLVLSTNGTLMKVAVANFNPPNSIAGAMVVSNSVTAAQMATNTLTFLNLSTNWLEGMTVYSNLLVNVSTNGPGTNTYLLTAASANVGTNGYPTNLQFRLTPVASLVQTAAFTNAVNSAITNAVNTNTFVTAEYAVALGRTATNHPFSGIPSRVNWVFVCKTNDIGYAAGEEIPLRSFNDNNASRYATAGASSTNIFVVTSEAGGTLFAVNGSSGAANAAPTIVRWRLKGYAAP